MKAKALRKSTDSQPLVVDAASGGRRQLRVTPAMAVVNRAPGGLDADEVQKLLEDVQHMAACVEHVAAISESLQEDHLYREAGEELTARKKNIFLAFSDLLAIYAAEIHATTEAFKRHNLSELKAG